MVEDIEAENVMYCAGAATDGGDAGDDGCGGDGILLTARLTHERLFIAVGPVCLGEAEEYLRQCTLKGALY